MEVINMKQAKAVLSYFANDDIFNQNPPPQTEIQPEIETGEQS
jgi:hypothetical protein